MEAGRKDWPRRRSVALWKARGTMEEEGTGLGIALTPELLERVRGAADAKELAALAVGEGIDMTLEQAEEVYARLHASGELADDELDDVAGGCDGGSPVCERCGSTMRRVLNDRLVPTGWYCPTCRKY